MRTLDPRAARLLAAAALTLLPLPPRAESRVNEPSTQLTLTLPGPPDDGASGIVHVAGGRLADGDLLLVVGWVHRGEFGTDAARFDPQGRRRWSRHLGGRSPVPDAVAWHKENRIVPVPDGGALVVGRSAARLSREGAVLWNGEGIHGRDDDPPRWFVRGGRVVAVGAAAYGGTLDVVVLDLATGKVLHRGALGAKASASTAASVARDGRIVVAQVGAGAGSRRTLRLEAFDLDLRRVAAADLPDAGDDSALRISAPPQELRDGSVIFVGEGTWRHLLRVDRALRLVAHAATNGGGPERDSPRILESPRGNLVFAPAPGREGFTVRTSADGAIREWPRGGRSTGGDPPLLDTWLSDAGDAVLLLGDDGRVVARPIGRDPEVELVELAARAPAPARDGAGLRVPLGIPRPVRYDVADPIQIREGPLAGATLDREKASWIPNVPGGSSVGWSSLPKPLWRTPVFVGTDGRVAAVVGDDASASGPGEPRSGAPLGLLVADPRAGRVQLTALWSTVRLAGEGVAIREWALVERGDALELVGRPERKSVDVAFLDAALRPVGRVELAVEGPRAIARTALILPDDSVVIALDGRERPDVRLARYTRAGQLTWQRDLPGAGRTMALRLRPDGSVAFAGPHGVRILSAGDGAVVAERALPLDEGVWTLADDGVVRLGAEGLEVVPLRGEPRSVRLDPPPGGGAHPLATPGEGVRLVALADGGVLVADAERTPHAVKGEFQTDDTLQARLRRVDRDGRVRWTARVGDTSTSLDWFWSHTNSGPDVWGPSDFGLVRRRWHGSTAVIAAAELPDGSVVATVGGTTTGAWKVEADGRTAWLRADPHLAGSGRPIALRDGAVALCAKGPRLGVLDGTGRPAAWTGPPATERERRDQVRVLLAAARSAHGELVVVEASE